MIKINEKFGIEIDANNYTAVEFVEGVSRKKGQEGQPTVNEKRAYFGKLEHCLNHIINQCGRDCESIEMLHAEILKAKKDILAACDDMSK